MNSAFESGEILIFDDEATANAYLELNPDTIEDTTYEGQAAKKFTKHEKEYLADLGVYIIKVLIFYMFGIPIP